jgi:SAM-dependent methyltransferase
MESAVYAKEAIVEATHWWFVGRRKLFATELSRAGIRLDARVLDVGTSTGTNLRLLRELGFQHVTGLDFSDEAIRYCEQKGFGPVQKGDICAIPFADGTFDLVLATDIVEHVDDDARAMKEIARVLSPGGIALLTVPAFQSLWGRQDEVSQHKRRYGRSTFAGLVTRASLRIIKCYYFNYLLFIPIWSARKLLSLLNVRVESENQINNAFLNWIFSGIFYLDVRTAPILRPPFGVSLFVTAKKT